MISRLLAPELRPGIYAWTFMFVVPWIRLPSSGVPYGLLEIVICFFFLLAFLIPAACPSHPSFERIKLSLTNEAMAVLALFSLIALATLYLSSGASGDLTLNELRELHTAGEIAIDSGYMRIHNLVAPAFAFWLFEVARRSNTRTWMIITFISLVMALFVSVKSFGGRYDVLCAACLVLITIILHRYDAIIAIPWPVRFSICVAGFVGMIIINSLFAAARTQNGMEGITMDLFYARGADIIRPTGISQPDFTVAISVGMVDEYLLCNIERFGMYLNEDNLKPAWGQHCFSLITRRLGYNNGPQFKKDVDELYMKYGIENNIWATGFRDFCIDFKIAGAMLFCFFLGLLYRLSRTTFYSSWFSHFLVAYVGTLLLISPVSSIFKSSYFQASFVMGILLLIADVSSGYAITKSICVRNESRRELAPDVPPATL